MIKLRELTNLEFGSRLHKYYVKSKKLTTIDNRPDYATYWFSPIFQPYNTNTNYRMWRHRSPEIIMHFTAQPCNTYCQDKLPMATCLVKDTEGKYWTCRHKVGNCPWKI